MPLDVMKTRMMNAPPGTYKSLMDCFKDIFKVGPSGFFKGFMPAFIRLGKKQHSIFFCIIFFLSKFLGPHTILMFIFLEQLKKQFGYIKTDNQ